MNYDLLKNVIELVEKFDSIDNEKHFTNDIEGFKQWIAQHTVVNYDQNLKWEGRNEGRSAESVISTLLVHMNRYAKNYSKAAIQFSEFSTQDEFIYLINLKAFGEMTKMELVKKNVHDKPAGMQIINRLIKQGWVKQKTSDLDKRSKIISITAKGNDVLDNQMAHIRKASKMVVGNLTEFEKIQLIYLLEKLEHFHLPIYLENDNNLEKLYKSMNILESF